MPKVTATRNKELSAKKYTGAHARFKLIPIFRTTTAKSEQHFLRNTSLNHLSDA